MARRLLPSIIRICLPKKYYDDIFIHHFLENVNLRMLSLKKTIRCFRLGFLPYEYLWFGLDRNDFRGYLPTRSNYQKRRINGSYNAILGNKILFECHLKTVLEGIGGVYVPDTLGYFEKGYLNSLHADLTSGDLTSVVGLLERGDLILKLISGDGGVGLVCLNLTDGVYYINDEAANLESLVAFLQSLDNYLIQRRLPQEGPAGTIFPGSVNTMRIGTMIDPGSGKPFIAYAVHRFGSLKTGFVDNVGQGGITAKIDLNSGRLSMAHQYSKEGQMEVFEKHPVTSAMIFNQEIPNWQDVKRRIIEMARRMPYLKYVGWDFVLSNDDLYVLEGNVSPGLGLVQMYGPLRVNEQAWNFFKFHGYVN
ncbi:MAG: hypothetical protein GT600_17180 [Bacteroidales bacterium]|nr:hypothetical protein [Bacteroidales bacterium]